MSASPSPVRSANLRFGCDQSSHGSDAIGWDGSHPPSRERFSVEVHELVPGPIDPFGEVDEAPGVERLNCTVDNGLTVLELDRREGGASVAGALTPISRLGDRLEEGVDRVTRVCEARL